MTSFLSSAHFKIPNWIINEYLHTDLIIYREKKQIKIILIPSKFATFFVQISVDN